VCVKYKLNLVIHIHKAHSLLYSIPRYNNNNNKIIIITTLGLVIFTLFCLIFKKLARK